MCLHFKEKKGEKQKKTNFHFVLKILCNLNRIGNQISIKRILKYLKVKYCTILFPYTQSHPRLD